MLRSTPLGHLSSVPANQTQPAHREKVRVVPGSTPVAAAGQLTVVARQAEGPAGSVQRCPGVHAVEGATSGTRRGTRRRGVGWGAWSQGETAQGRQRSDETVRSGKGPSLQSWVRVHNPLSVKPFHGVSAALHKKSSQKSDAQVNEDFPASCWW